jgi:cell division protein FtsB
MSVAERVWSALTAIVKLEDKVSRQAEVLKDQQSKIDDLHARVIRLEAQLELLTNAALVKRLKARD